MSVLRIDPSTPLGPVAAIRGVMTEWMFTPGVGDQGRSVDPQGVEYSYGQLLSLEKEDFVRAAQVGVNTLRCAVAHTDLEEADQPGKYKSLGFDRLGEIIDWCDEVGIDVVIDIHNALGREGGGDPRLWQEKSYQDRFCAIWSEIAKRFKDHRRVVGWEPLNEPEPRHVPDMAGRYKVWNELAKRVTDSIRTAGTDKPIIINAIEYANASAFEGLEPTGDDNTLYSFHWYAPSKFHKQLRPWMKDRNTYHYPGEFEGRFWDRRTIIQEWAAPLAFAEKHNVPLFCGEFGCVGDTPEMEDMVWLLDVISAFDQFNIGWTYYHYMFRTPERYWKNHFDCNMFIHESDTGVLRTNHRKVDLLGDLMKLRGQTLAIPEPEDQNLHAAAYLLQDGSLRLYLSNRCRSEDGKLQLAVEGNWQETADVKRMAVGTAGWVDADNLTLTDGKLDVDLPQLTILSVTLKPKA